VCSLSLGCLGLDCCAPFRKASLFGVFPDSFTLNPLPAGIPPRVIFISGQLGLALSLDDEGIIYPFRGRPSRIVSPLNPDNVERRVANFSPRRIAHL